MTPSRRAVPVRISRKCCVCDQLPASLAPGTLVLEDSPRLAPLRDGRSLVVGGGDRYPNAASKLRPVRARLPRPRWTIWPLETEFFRILGRALHRRLEGPRASDRSTRRAATTASGGSPACPPDTAETFATCQDVRPLCGLTVRAELSVGATLRTGPTGVVLVDKDDASAAGTARRRVPYGCRCIDPRTQHGRQVQLCCYRRIAKGLTTACVRESARRRRACWVTWKSPG